VPAGRFWPGPTPRLKDQGQGRADRYTELSASGLFLDDFLRLFVSFPTRRYADVCICRCIALYHPILGPLINSKRHSGVRRALPAAHTASTHTSHAAATHTPSTNRRSE
jgi:hypothetical protein